MTKEDSDREADLRRIKLAVAGLMEHFDTVHVFATRLVHDGTLNMQWGAGNWFARYGQVNHWLNTTDARDADGAVRDVGDD